MSKAGKIPASQFAASPAKSFRRVVGQRPKRRFFLIVCEGEKTEPNYFEAIRLKLPKDMIPKVFVRGTGKNTLSLIEEVEEIIEQRRAQDLPPFYNVWIVMDRDSFPPDDFDSSIVKIEQHPETPGAKKWFSAWSNEAFELWYLLHFTGRLVVPFPERTMQQGWKSFLDIPIPRTVLRCLRSCRTKPSWRFNGRSGAILCSRNRISHITR